MQATSLPVPSVQELVKQTITKVPERYVHSNQDPIVLSNTNFLPQIITNGIYRSIEHRAIVNSKKERISIATFHRLNMSRVIGPIPCLITPERPALFKTIGVADFFNGYLSRKLEGKSYLDALRIKNEIGK
ncbi:unnamed protein product [Vicia faba]|uniref:Isopenicillin N synthase-like Fe(2+) 2OG dioxygenase domain-containing protein n=1 Tax=Vicia faba TaxID=3906 RepID=A0AAV0YQ01_VICFA|nr:unnamed protein product [Vicia faba]